MKNFNGHVKHIGQAVPAAFNRCFPHAPTIHTHFFPQQKNIYFRLQTYFSCKCQQLAENYTAPALLEADYNHGTPDRHSPSFPTWHSPPSL